MNIQKGSPNYYWELLKPLGYIVVRDKHHRTIMHNNDIIHSSKRNQDIDYIEDNHQEEINLGKKLCEKHGVEFKEVER